MKLKLYFIMGSVNTAGRDPLVVLEEALKGGVTCFQLREKGEGALEGDALRTFAEACKKICHRYDVPFIVNDDIDLALAIDADGVHVGQEDGDIPAIRRQIGSSKLLGVSTHNIEEALAAAEAGADYIGIGPIYSTKTKVDAQSVIGPEMIRQVASLLPGLPMVGIGGISERKASAVIRAGASGVAVVSAIAGQDDPLEAARRLKGTIRLSLTGAEM